MVGLNAKLMKYIPKADHLNLDCKNRVKPVTSYKYPGTGFNPSTKKEKESQPAQQPLHQMLRAKE